MGTQNITDNGNGILVGVEAPQPRMANDWPTQQQTPAQQVSQPVQVVDPPATGVQPSGRFFTEEDLAKARQQEKDKLYPRLEEMKTQLDTIQKERDELARQRQEEAKRLANEAKKKEEEQMELRDLLEKREREMNERLQQIERQREQDRAVYEQERRLMELENYKRSRIEQESEFILPELRDLIRGGTPDEVDQSIEDAKKRTDAIIGNFTAVASPSNPIPRGAAPTAPPVGPLEQMTTFQTLTPEDIKGMDIETYKRYREQLLATANRQYRGRP